MQKKWLLKKLPEDSEIQRLQSELSIPRAIAVLLLQRGITTFDEARSFFRPNVSDLHPPFLMKGMKEAVERIKNAKQNNEKILVFGDYDVDGTSAVALMSLFLNENKFDTEFYIPDRYKEGYGVSINGIEYAQKNNFSLIIALDCGVTAVEKIAYAKTLSIDFIVCDHHLPEHQLPDAIVLNPKQADCNYPYKELCGCGIAFKLAQAYAMEMGQDEGEVLQYTDLVAIASGADIVPITGENRILCHAGLRQINQKKRRKGLDLLLKKAKKVDELTLTDVVFIIAPRINAAGRMDSGMDAVRLLLGEETSELAALVEKIEALNTARKELDQQITAEILTESRQTLNFEKRKTTVVHNDGWHKGVVGIVASRLMEQYYRPTIVLTRSGDAYTGSVRSVAGFNVYQALQGCSDLLQQFGGHAAAAGLTIHTDKLDTFKAKFEEVVSNSITIDQLIRQEEVSMELRFDEIFMKTESPYKIPKLKRILREFEPTGPGNRKPVFLSTSVFIDPTQSSVVGEGHLKLTLFQSEFPHQIKAIGFDLGHKMDELDTNQAVSIVYTLEENTWREKTTLQLNLKDIRQVI